MPTMRETVTHIKKHVSFDGMDLTTATRQRRDSIVMRGRVDMFTGYGQLFCYVAQCFIKMGFDVRIMPISMDLEKVPVDPEILSRFIDLDEAADVLIHPADVMHHLLNPTRLNEIAFTMWEASRIRQEAVDALNAYGRALVVPNAWNASCLNACGVDIPVRIVPLGIDPRIYHQQPMPPRDEAFVFGAAGRMAHGGCRKGLNEVMQAFSMAFPDEKDVKLRIKAHDDCGLDTCTDPRVEVARKFMSEAEMSTWYESNHCFVSAAKSEGWGLHQHQSMAVGRPVIAIRFSGLDEFFNDRYGYEVDYRIAEATDFYANLGVWAEPRLDSLVEQMRRAYENFDEVVDKGKAAARQAQRFTYQHTADKLLEVINELG